jgi:signal transduction histidine kinase
MLGLVGLSTVLLAGIVGFLFSGTITRRLTALREATERLSEGDLTARADEKPGAPELRSVSKSFNLMAERLQTLLNQQKAFAADASHQLRTPLTALKLRLEMARDLLETDPAAASTRLAAAEAEVDRMGNIIEGLLMLSRTEASSAPVVTVDLAEIARERATQWEPLAEESGVRIRYEGPAHALVQAVSTAAEQIIDNYVDNALTQSPSGSEIIVRVAPDGADTTVHVLDQGPGLSPEECVRAFDRFWRAASDSRGSGLGLAIVSQLAVASRATVALSPRTDASVAAFAGTAKSARPAKSRAATGPGLDASASFVTSR